MVKYDMQTRAAVAACRDVRNGSTKSVPLERITVAVGAPPVPLDDTVEWQIAPGFEQPPQPSHLLIFLQFSGSTQR